MARSHLRIRRRRAEFGAAWRNRVVAGGKSRYGSRSDPDFPPAADLASRLQNLPQIRKCERAITEKRSIIIWLFSLSQVGVVFFLSRPCPCNIFPRKRRGRCAEARPFQRGRQVPRPAPTAPSGDAGRHAHVARHRSAEVRPGRLPACRAVAASEFRFGGGPHFPGQRLAHA